MTRYSSSNAKKSNRTKKKIHPPIIKKHQRKKHQRKKHQRKNYKKV